MTTFIFETAENQAKKIGPLQEIQRIKEEHDKNDKASSEDIQIYSINKENRQQEQSIDIEGFKLDEKLLQSDSSEPLNTA